MEKEDLQGSSEFLLLGEWGLKAFKNIGLWIMSFDPCPDQRKLACMMQQSQKPYIFRPSPIIWALQLSLMNESNFCRWVILAWAELVGRPYSQESLRQELPITLVFLVFDLILFTASQNHPSTLWLIKFSMSLSKEWLKTHKTSGIILKIQPI